MKKIFTKSDKFTSEYCCTIVRIGEIRPIENADFLVQTTINGENAVIGKSQIKEGDILFYSSNETQLNADFLRVNNLYSIDCRDFNDNHEEVERLYQEGKKDEIKERKLVGYFDKRGRVQMKRFRGTPSMGYLFSLNEMVKYCPNAKDVDLEELVGEDFDTVDGELFVKAYIPYVPPRQESIGRRNETKRMNRLKKFERLVKNEFLLHYDTDPLPKFLEEGGLKPTDEVTISPKFHGCVERSTIVNTMEFGDKTIGEIVDNKLDCHIKGYDTSLQRIVFVPIGQFYRVPNDGEWYELELDNGQKVIITGNNPIWCEDLQCYRRVDELKGDEVLLFDK